MNRPPSLWRASIAEIGGVASCLKYKSRIEKGRMSTKGTETFSIPIAASPLHRQQLTILLQKASKRRSRSEKNTVPKKVVDKQPALVVNESASGR
jgi:hypothetical protein